MDNNFYISEKPKSMHVLDGLTLKETINWGSPTSYREYTLREVTYKELLHLRLSKQPGLVLKRNGKLYYTEFRKDVNFNFHNLGPHLCGMCSNVCKHCEKVDDWTLQFHLRNGCTFKTAVYRAGRIEKYPFIPYALETFNCNQDTYLILECGNHQ